MLRHWTARSFDEDRSETTTTSSIPNMSPPSNREEILNSLRQSIDNGELIVGAGAGIGLSAKFIEQGGGDLIIIYNSGRYRMAGRGSLAGLMPYGNANDVVLEMVSDKKGLIAELN
jgi:predicted TIM-barrel enzyme